MSDPLPPGARTESADIRMRPTPCPKCGALLQAQHVEELPDGYRLDCPACGFAFLSFDEGVSDACGS